MSSPPELSTINCICVAMPDPTSTAPEEASTVAGKTRPGCWHGNTRLGPDLDRRRVILRHVNSDAQPARPTPADVTKARAQAAFDQRADVSVAFGDEAVERRGDLLVARENLQALDIRLGGMDRLLVLQVGGALIDILLGDGVRGQQHAPAAQRDIGKLGAGSCACKIGLRLQQLLVEVRRFDFGKDLASLHRSADIDANFSHSR